MHVGEEPDAQTVERRRQPEIGERRLGDAEAMPFVADAVHGGAGHRADGRREHAFESSAAGEAHSSGV